MSGENRLRAVFLELYRKSKAQPGEWCWVRLKQGALVAVRLRADQNSRHELRIARKAETAGEAWEREVATFLRAWLIEPLDGTRPCTTPNQWFRHTQNHEDGVVETLLIELRRGECKPDRALCWICLQRDGKHTEIPWFPLGNERGQALSRPCPRARERAPGCHPRRLRT